MEQISKLLFVVTGLSIFCYAIMFAFVEFAGNGGEYWGFDGREDPRYAAVRSYNDGDYRLLAFDLTDSAGNRARETPNMIHCDSLTGTMDTSVQLNHIQSMHGTDSVSLASEFSRRYNHRMKGMLIHEYGYRCEELVD